MAAYGMALAEARRSKPADDLTTNLVQAEVDGERLSDYEVASFFILLGAAGNETTRNAISHGVAALTRYPEQKADVVDRLRRPRRAPPSRRSCAGRRRSSTCAARATEDTDVGGQKIAAGDKLTMWYNSANRDETKFDKPFRFDVARDPNPQVGLRRRRTPLLPRRQPGPARDHGGVRGAAPADPRHRGHRRARASCVAVHPRHQAPAGGMGPGSRRGRQVGGVERDRAAACAGSRYSSRRVMRPSGAADAQHGRDAHARCRRAPWPSARAAARSRRRARCGRSRCSAGRGLGAHPSEGAQVLLAALDGHVEVVPHLHVVGVDGAHGPTSPASMAANRREASWSISAGVMAATLALPVRQAVEHVAGDLLRPGRRRRPRRRPSRCTRS